MAQKKENLSSLNAENITNDSNKEIVNEAKKLEKKIKKLKLELQEQTTEKKKKKKKVAPKEEKKAAPKEEKKKKTAPKKIEKKIKKLKLELQEQTTEKKKKKKKAAPKEEKKAAPKEEKKKKAAPKEEKKKKSDVKEEKKKKSDVKEEKKKKSDVKEEKKTFEEELEEQLSDEEIENFQIEKMDMEKLTNKVCEIVARYEAGGMIQSELWKKLKLSSRDGSRLALKLERIGIISREKILEKGRWTYKLIIKKTPVSTQSIVDAPCLTCPVEQKCSIEGEISPRTCQLIEDWVLVEISKSKKK